MEMRDLGQDGERGVARPLQCEGRRDARAEPGRAELRCLKDRALAKVDGCHGRENSVELHRELADAGRVDILGGELGRVNLTACALDDQVVVCAKEVSQSAELGRVVSMPSSTYGQAAGV